MSLERLVATSPSRLSPGDAAYLARMFGDYAAWVLDEAVLTKAAQALGHPAVTVPVQGLLSRRDVAAGLFVRDDRFPALRETFVVPVQWANGPAKETCRLRRLEKIVADMLCQSDWLERRWARKPLKLVPVGRLHSQARNLLFESDRFTWDSATGSLLLSAIQTLCGLTGPVSSEPVLVCFSFDPLQGVQPVEHVTRKATLVRLVGARTIVVAESQRDEFERALESSVPPIAVHGVPDGVKNLEELLKRLRQVFLLPPADDAEEGTLADYYLLLHRIDREQAFAHYRDTLLPRIVDRIRNLQSEALRPLEARTLLTVLSKNPETTYMGIASLRPTVCYVIQLGRDAELDRARTWLEHEVSNTVPHTHLKWREYSDQDHFLADSHALRTELRENGVEDGALIVDLTPGPKPVSFGLLFQVVDQSDYVCYLEHRWEDHLPRPFTERYRISRGGFSANGPREKACTG